MILQKTCFVVQGFGEKTDFTNGRRLNLDASYQVIREAVIDAGLICIGADEVVHSGTIDRPMYEWLMRADLVIADLSTYNVNAAYELGVRYGVSPRATILVAEEEFKNPFDVSHIVIHRYKHLGEDVGASEAKRFRHALTDLIRRVISEDKPDSPLYELFSLHPPVVRSHPMPPPDAANAARAGDTGLPDSGEESARALMENARQALTAGRFGGAIELLRLVRGIRPNDEYVVQQLALATYKSEHPDPVTALLDAREILRDLDPHTTNDPETLGLWGAVHKRLWECGGDTRALEQAIAAYERGFHVKRDSYNGINLAFLLNVRGAEHQEAGRGDDAVTDFVLARRVRQEVLQRSQQALDRGLASSEDEYWIVATLWEAAVGLEDHAGAAEWQRRAERCAAAPWMLESSRAQLAALGTLLAASPLRRAAGVSAPRPT